MAPAAPGASSRPEPLVASERCPLPSLRSKRTPSCEATRRSRFPSPSKSARLAAGPAAPAAAEDARGAEVVTGLAGAAVVEGAGVAAVVEGRPFPQARVSKRISTPAPGPAAGAGGAPEPGG